MSQQQIADTLGVGQKQVSTDLNRNTSNEDDLNTHMSNEDDLNRDTSVEDPPPTITNSRGQERPATQRRQVGATASSSGWVSVAETGFLSPSVSYVWTYVAEDGTGAVYGTEVEARAQVVRHGGGVVRTVVES